MADHIVTQYAEDENGRIVAIRVRSVMGRAVEGMRPEGFVDTMARPAPAPAVETAHVAVKPADPAVSAPVAGKAE